MEPQFYMCGRALIIPRGEEYFYDRRVESPHCINAYKQHGTDCAVCGKEFNSAYSGNLVHHIDGNHTNQDISNLIVLCPTCHGKIHNRSRGRFVPHESNSAEIEERLFDLASKVKFKSSRIPGKGWLLEKINNKTSIAIEKSLQPPKTKAG